MNVSEYSIYRNAEHQNYDVRRFTLELLTSNPTFLDSACKVENTVERLQFVILSLPIEHPPPKGHPNLTSGLDSSLRSE